jgi:hypothetical protein
MVPAAGASSKRSARPPRAKGYRSVAVGSNISRYTAAFSSESSCLAAATPPREIEAGLHQATPEAGRGRSFYKQYSDSDHFYINCTVYAFGCRLNLVMYTDTVQPRARPETSDTSMAGWLRRHRRMVVPSSYGYRSMRDMATARSTRRWRFRAVALCAVCCPQA